MFVYSIRGDFILVIILFCATIKVTREGAFAESLMRLPCFVLIKPTFVALFF